MHCCMRAPVSKCNRDSVGPCVMIYRPGTGRRSFRIGSASYVLDSDLLPNLQNCNVDEAHKYRLFRSVRISECPNIIRHCHLTTYLLTPWSRFLLEKLTGSQLVKKFPVFYGTRRFITAFTRARQLPLF